MDYLVKNRIQGCAKLLSYNSEIIDVFNKIPIEISDNRELMEKVIVAFHTEKRPEVNLEVGEKYYNDVVQGMVVEYGEDFELVLADPTSKSLEPLSTCNFLLELDKRISRLGKSKRELVLRYLYSPE